VTSRRPDFSGEYVLNRAASTLSALGAASVQAASLRIHHAEPSFRCESKFSFPNIEPIQWTFELTTIAGASYQSPSEPDVRWDEGALMVSMPNGAATITFRYEFDEDGRLRMAEQLRGTDHDQNNLWIFDRA
jgi:hypothetical protein